MDLEITIQSELSQIQKAKHHKTSLTSGILKKKWYKLIYLQKKQANRHIQVYGYQRGKVHGEGKIESLGLTDTHFYVYKIDKQQDLLYSTGDHNQYVVRCSVILSLKSNVP